MQRMNQDLLERPGPSRQALPLETLGPSYEKRKTSKVQRSLHLAKRQKESGDSSSSDSASSSEMGHHKFTEQRKLYRRLRRENQRQTLENNIMSTWKNLQVFADRDNYKNHFREAMMTAAVASNNENAVENAGVLMAIEEFGLGMQERLNPLLQFYGLQTDTSISSVSGSSSTCTDDSEITDSSFSSISSTSHSNSAVIRRRDKPSSCVSKMMEPSGNTHINSTIDANFSFEDFAVNAAIQNKGLSL